MRGIGTCHATVAEVMSELDVARHRVAELHVSKATLEDVFLELTDSDACKRLNLRELLNLR